MRYARGVAGTLFVVATPIGNLGDVTLRAIETLRAADRVLAEDTRRTLALLSHLGISGKPVDRLDAHAPAEAVERAAARLEAGESLALVTDAGTPLVSDPGAALVRLAAARGMRVVPIPGASAVLAAVSASGLVAGPFRFLGFLPRGGPERREALERVASTEEPVVLFESPERTQATLRDLASIAPGREVVVARELTKLHEELARGTVGELASNEREWIGEVTIVLGEGSADTGAPALDEAEIDRRIDEGLAKGRRARDIAEELSLVLRVPRKELYSRVVGRRHLSRGGRRG
jgi:16S rRNA (cytidine1402-2'-O)-methyltransferase